MKPTEKFRPLRERFDALSRLPDSEWEWFAPHVSEKKLARGEVWLHQRGPSDTIGFIERGLTRTFFLMLDGGEYTRNFRYDGQFVAPYSATLSGAPSNVSIEALESTTLFTFPHADFTKGYSRHASWDVIARKLAEAQYIARAKREYELLCLDAAERLASFREDYGAIAGRLSQTHIASYLGITPVSLSRLTARGRQKVDR